jgi:hypothetical protein
VDAVSEGVIELGGVVRDRTEAERAIGIAHGITGVYTVVNRLRIDEEEAHQDATSRRWIEGDPSLRERHHYGMGVGMGTRRQSPSTDPDRPSDKQRLLERELDVANVEDDTESIVPPRPVPDEGDGEVRPAEPAEGEEGRM